MAASGSFDSSAFVNTDGTTRCLTFSWQITSQSVASNSTTISWTLKGGGTNSTKYFLSGNFKVVIDGKTVYSTGADDRIKLYKGTTIASGTQTLAHNDDGTRSFAVSIQGGVYQYAVNCTGSQTITLDVIARASQPSLVTWPETTQNVGDFGETFSIHTNRKSDQFTHTVRYEYGTRKGTIATGVTNNTTWAVPVSFMNDIPNSTSGSGRIYVDTYKGSTLVGTKYTGFTAKVPASVKPTCTLTLEDITGVDDIYGSPVQGLSKIKITVGFTAAYSSPMSSCKITANGASSTETSTTTGLLQASGASPVTANVTDKRGRSGSASYTMNVLAYTAPRVTSLTVHRCDADGNTTDQGEYIKIIFSAAISSMSSKNTAAYKLRYKKSTASSWTEVALSALANKYAVTDHTYIFAADESSSYEVEVIATDRHGSATRATSASTAFSLMDWHPSGTGARWGGVAELENTFQIDLELRQTANRYAFNTPGEAGTVGFIRMVSIEIIAANADTPITFIFSRRQALTDMKVSVQLRNSAMTASSLSSIRYEGSNYGAFLVQTSTMVWDLYIQKGSNYDTIALQDWYTSKTMASRIRVTFPGDLVDTVPNPYHRATPAVLESILDAFMPVGFVLTLYSHADPNDMYPGTTWARISGGFLWASQDGDIIGQTGGAKEVTLTVDQIPSHTHGSVYSGNASGTKTHAWLASGGTAMAYGTVATGGGKAHNNMPPYVQVSIWRRTA